MSSEIDFLVVVPARYGSIRLPGKPLRVLAGQPMIRHVYDRAVESGANRVIVATDDERIRDCCLGFGAEAVLTSRDHQTGTDRLAEVVRAWGLPDETIVVNMQGDEPLMPPALPRQAARALATRPEAAIATLAAPIDYDAIVDDPNVVKVVCDRGGFALYFSRAPIPWDRDARASGASRSVPGVWRRHIGLYAYRAAFLRRYPDLSRSPLETLECLEQLRALWHGERIYVSDAVETPGPGVDTEADLAKVAALLG